MSKFRKVGMRSGSKASPAGSNWHISDAVIESWSANKSEPLIIDLSAETEPKQAPFSISFAPRYELSADDMGMKYGGAGAFLGIGQAFEAGKFVAVTDASATMGGRAAWSVGIFDAFGRLVLDESGCFHECMGSTQAEYQAITKAIELLENMGASDWACFSDSQSSVSMHARNGLPRGGSIAWVPRACVKPANDRARIASGLRTAAPASWDSWLDLWQAKAQAA